MKERTLAIIKPDAVKKRVIGRIIQRIEDEGFNIIGLKMVKLSQEEAKNFYAVHKDKPFYDSLTEFMSSGPIVVILLEGEQAVKHWREVMGATNPAEARPGTLRREFGFSIERNAVHGSDSPQTAEAEIKFFFN
ncbi:MAG TPA: nucleoside-diphosphate kinase [Candidatus Saccharicenans sp.]|jgi:nucleoside-diphosphate kinase|nr:nucleoside-diphosphate kinase [Candidatus Saccharicenans sp.]HOM94881.1 nucleoside-diphosphate kinase [Candidatus Saccharicenans sp.]HPU94292.1 nucleoside-diphosphate kinase [Candidatus Saccharicenans sp.]HQE65074.1 nucleoside-diphosphate kinase [Candidatus Saccharicenans sp.]HQH61702.1 nucleoside-diphosphate kinase [Candidatus Saccharicenans sp.]